MLEYAKNYILKLNTDINIEYPKTVCKMTLLMVSKCLYKQVF